MKATTNSKNNRELRAVKLPHVPRKADSDLDGISVSIRPEMSSTARKPKPRWPILTVPRFYP